MQKTHKAIFLGFLKRPIFHISDVITLLMNIQYLKFKLSGQVVTPLLLGMN